MCGIAGFTCQQIGTSENRHSILASMLDVIGYRGPDQTGVNVTSKVAFGHQRLSIIEPQGGRQPRVHPHSGNALVYSGEIYAHRNFQAEIRAAGHELRDHCDTEILFWLIEMHGVHKTAQMLDGMFAFAYHDNSNDTVHLARDAFGQKPLFYTVADGDLIFASEIKALLQHPSLASRSADIDALSLYLMMEYVPGDRTGIQGIYEVPPGHVLTWSKGQLSLRPYWQTSDVSRLAGVNADKVAQQFEHLLSNAVEEQLVADVPVGIFLSGGLDSSMIAAMARRHRKDVATFTIKFPQASFDESTFAQDVANVLDTRHTTIELDRRNCVDGLEELIARVDQPFADSSFLPTYLLCKATRQHVTVALGGDGADELLFGYPNFRALRYSTLLQRCPRGLGNILERLASKLPSSQSYMNTSFLVQQLSYGIGLPATMQSVYWMSAVAAREQGALWIDAPDREQQLFEQVAAQIDSTPNSDLLESCRQHFLNEYLPGNILQKTDRASMYSSLEVRAPFLSSKVAKFALSLPRSELFDGKKGKLLLRSVAANYIPAIIIERKKHGFPLPVSTLLRGDIKDTVADVLLDDSNPVYQHLRNDIVQRYWTQHQSGNAEHGKKLWALFMLATFFRNTF